MQKVKNPIGKRLIRNIILISTCFSLFATGIQLFDEYQNEKEAIEIRLEQVKASSYKSLSLNLWEDNKALISVQLESLLHFHDISFVGIKIEGRKSIFFGEDLEDDSIIRKYRLTHMYNNKTYELGTLVLQSSLINIRSRVAEKFYLIAITQTIKTFIVAFLMLYIFYYMVTQHLEKIVEFSQKIIDNPADLKENLNLNTNGDEFEVLAENLNLLKEVTSNKIHMFKEKSEGLNEINNILEKRLNLNMDNTNTVVIEKAALKDIKQLIYLIENSSSDTDTFEAVKQDMASLIIMNKRLFKDIRALK